MRYEEVRVRYLVLRLVLRFCVYPLTPSFLYLLVPGLVKGSVHKVGRIFVTGGEEGKGMRWKGPGPGGGTRDFFGPFDF